MQLFSVTKVTRVRLLVSIVDLWMNFPEHTKGNDYKHCF